MFRELLGKKVSLLALESDLAKSTISKVENGTSHASAAVLDAIARQLGVELVDLVTTPGDRLRHAVIDATRGMGDEALRELLGHARGSAVSPPSHAPFRDAPTPRSVARVPSVIPLLGLDVAAGGFDPTKIDRGVRYVRPNTRTALHGGCFVVRVIGRSMEPRVPNGAYAIFSSRVAANPSGEIVLAQYGGHIDADTSASYTVKIFRGVTAREGTGRAWQSASLEPINPAYQAIVIDPERGEDLKIIAQFIEVLVSAPA